MHILNLPTELLSILPLYLEVVEPISQLLFREVGNHHREVKPTVSRATVSKSWDTPQRSVYSHIIYCELFHHWVDQVSEKEVGELCPLSAAMRKRWVECCIPSPDIFTQKLPHDGRLRVTEIMKSGPWLFLQEACRMVNRQEAIWKLTS